MDSSSTITKDCDLAVQRSRNEKTPTTVSLAESAQMRRNSHYFKSIKYFRRFWPRGYFPPRRAWGNGIAMSKFPMKLHVFCGFSSGPKARHIPAWGIAPGKRFIENSRGLKARHIFVRKPYIGPSALTVFYSIFPGAMPQAGIDPGRWPSIQECKRQ